MNRCNPFLFAGILLLSIACKKDAPPPPEPLLEGRWDFRSTITYHYDGSGQMPSKNEQFPGQYGAFYLVLTKDSLKYVRTADNTPLRAYKIIRNGAEIQIPRINQKPVITVLTARDLTLRFHKLWVITSTGAYDDVEDNYVR